MFKRNDLVDFVGHSVSARQTIFVSFVLFIAINAAMAKDVQASKLSERVSSFASDFYRKCADESPNENIIVSPLSVANALALLAQGAQTKTFKQIANGLHSGSSNKSAMAVDFAKYTDALTAGVGQSTLSMPNQIYVPQGCQIRKVFRATAAKHFKADVESLNFDKAAAAATKINAFVASKTNNKIKDLIRSDALDSNTRLVLVNAIYFKGNWERRFASARTAAGDFYLDATETVRVDFMRNTDDYRYARLDDLDAAALELKYAKSNISFVVVLPNSRTGLPALEAALTDYGIAKILDRMYKQKVEVMLPKFKVEYEIELNVVLQKLGMVDMFGDNADFGGLMESSVPIKVSKVIHKACVEVNEEGAEAAAATAGIVVMRSLQPPCQPFHADHAFLYFILDTKTGSNIFSGRCTKFN